jgi:hypothetical protein
MARKLDDAAMRPSLAGPTAVRDQEVVYPMYSHKT